MAKTEFKRRSFLGALVAWGGAILLLPASIAQSAKKKVKKLAIGFDKIGELKVVGGFKQIKLMNRDVLLIRNSEKTVVAFDPTCTHQKCNVDYQPDTKDIKCSCHKSHFDLTGKVLDGPAPAPLTRFRTKLDGNRVLIALPVEE